MVSRTQQVSQLLVVMNRKTIKLTVDVKKWTFYFEDVMTNAILYFEELLQHQNIAIRFAPILSTIQRGVG